MAHKNQLFESRTEFIATRGVKEYRETIPTWVTADDVVLEIGCEWGTTTTGYYRTPHIVFNRHAPRGNHREKRRFKTVCLTLHRLAFRPKAITGDISNFFTFPNLNRIPTATPQ